MNKKLMNYADVYHLSYKIIEDRILLDKESWAKHLGMTNSLQCKKWITISDILSGWNEINNTDAKKELANIFERSLLSEEIFTVDNILIQIDVKYYEGLDQSYKIYYYGHRNGKSEYQTIDKEIHISDELCKNIETIEGIVYINDKDTYIGNIDKDVWWILTKKIDNIINDTSYRITKLYESSCKEDFTTPGPVYIYYKYLQKKLEYYSKNDN